MVDDYDDIDRVLAQLNSDVGDFPDSEVSNDRNPIEIIGKSAATSAFNRLVPPSKRAELIASALPKPYSDAVSNYRDLEYNVRDLYSHTKEELVATERALQRKANQLAPKILPFLPKSLAEKYQKWASKGEEDNDWGWGWSGDSSENRDEEINAIVNNALRNNERLVARFEDDSKKDLELEAKDKAKSEIKEFTRDLRSQEDSANISGIKTYLERLLNDSSTIMNWRRKSLEVGIRQLFTLTDIVAIMKASNDRVLPALEAIVKNTALPDYAKENVTEIATAMSKRRLIESINPVEFSREFLQDFTQKAMRKIGNLGREIRGNLSSVPVTEDLGFEGKEKTEEELLQEYLEGGGTLAGDYLSKKFFIPVRDRILKKSRKITDKNDTIREMGEALKYYSGNLSSIYNTELSDETEDSLLKTIITLLSDVKGGYQGERISIASRDEDWLASPSVPDNRLYITQTEIIPAYLRSIDSAVWLLNGEERDSVYDIDNRSLVSATSFNRRLRRDVSQSNVKQYYKRGLEDLVDKLDPDKELSEEGRSDLKEYFDDRVKKNLTFDINELAKDDNMTEIMRDYDDTIIFEEILDRIKQDKRTFEKMNEFSRGFDRLRQLSGSYQREINRAIAKYGDKALVDAGIFKMDDFNRLEVDDRLMDPDVKFEDILVGDEVTGKKNKRQLFQDIFKPRVEEKVELPEPKVTTEKPTLNRSSITDYDISQVLEKLSNINPTVDLSGIERTIAKLNTTERLVDYKPELENIRTDLSGEGGVISILKEIRDKSFVVSADDDSDENVAATTSKKNKPSMFRTIANNTREILEKGWKKTSDKTGNVVAGARDVYNEEGRKVLSGAKLKSGEYWSKKDDNLTKIKTIEDISGPVYDKEGVEVVSEEELGDLDKLHFHKEGRWRRLTESLGNKFNHLRGARDSIRNKLVTGKDLIRGAKTYATDYLFNLPDIYVAGEDKPRLRAVLIKEGFYHSNDKVIKKLDDITGEVKDKNNRIIISQEEFDSPDFKLVDSEGNDVRSRFGRAVNFIKNRLTSSVDTAIAAYTSLRKVGSRVKKRIGKLWNKEDTEESEVKPTSSIFSKFKEKVKGTVKKDSVDSSNSYSVLVKIHNLLNQRMRGRRGDDLPEDGGLVNTSKIKQRANSAAEKVKEKIANVKEKGVGETVKEKLKTVKSDIDTKDKKSTISKILRHRKAKDLVHKRRVKRGLEEESLVDKAKRKVSKVARDASESSIAKKTKSKISGVINDITKSIDAPTDKFKKSDIRVGLKDPQIELLKRIADSSEGNWVRGMAEDAQKYGAERSFQSQMMLNFSKRFRGGVSRLYKKMANLPREGKEKGIFGKIKDKWDDTKGKEKSDSFGGRLLAMLSGTLGALSTSFTSVLNSILAKFGISAAGSVMGGLAKGAGAIALGGLKTVGKVLGGAGRLGAGLLKASFAISKTSLAVASSLLSGIGAVITSPITLGVAAVAGAGYLAYRAYVRKNPTILGRVRMAQYGSRSHSDWSRDDAIKFIYLENELLPFVRRGGTGYVVRGLSNEKMAELAKGYGIDEENEVELESFYSYIINRFIPFLLMWVQRLEENNISAKLPNLEDTKLDYETQKLIINNVRLQTSHPIYRTAVDPSKADRGIFKKFTDWVGFSNNELLSGEEVDDVVAKALRELDDLIAKQKKQSARDDKKREFNDNLKRGEDAFARAYNKEEPKDPRQDKTIEEAYKAMYANDKPTKQWHVGSIQNKEVESNEVTLSSKVKVGMPGPIESARAALYGLRGVDHYTIGAIRELERLAGLYINHKTGDVDLVFYEKAVGHVHSLGGSAQEKYGAAYPNVVKSWLRERFVGMYIAYMKAMGEVVGGGAILNPSMDDKVYSVLVSLLETTSVGGNLVIKLPISVDMVGNFILLKTSSDILAVLESFKPRKNTIDAKDAKSNINTKVAKLGPYKPTEEHKESDHLTAVRERAAKIAEEKTKRNNTINVREMVVSKEGSGEYSNFSNVDIRSREDLALLIGKISEAQGVDPDLMITTALVESSLNPNAKAPKGSAKGLFQFLDKTWNEQMEKHGNRLGIPAGTDATDPIAATLLAAEYFRANTSALGEGVNVVDSYMTHFLGAGGARKFLRAYNSNPNAIALEEFSAEAKNNPNVFFNTNGKPKTYEDIYRDFTNKFVARSSQVRSITGGEYGGSVFKDATDTIVKRDVRREEAIVNKAKREVTNTNTIEESMVNLKPDGTSTREGYSAAVEEPVERVVDNKVEDAKHTTPNMSEKDTERYREALTELYSRPTRQELAAKQPQSVGMYDSLIDSYTNNTKSTNDILNKQLNVQEKLLLVMTHMDKKVGLMLKDKVSEREIRQNELTEIKEKSAMEIPIDLSNRTVNISRNKSV